MKLTAPFFISSRLAPAVKVGNATLSYGVGGFVIDFPDGSEHKVEGFRFPACRMRGQTDGDVLREGFAAVLGFLGACAESRSYGERDGRDPMTGDNSDLFPPEVGEWAQQYSDEIAMAECEITEAEGSIQY